MPEIKGAQLKTYSYYGTGGSCDLLLAPAAVGELAAAMAELHKRGVPYFLLGGGTNSLVMDEHWPGAVILFTKMNRLHFAGDKAEVGAGVENSAFAQACLERGLAGAAWMYRLPGQMGGTVRMNARCYGGEISEVVTKVTAVTKTGEVKVYDCQGDPRRSFHSLGMTGGPVPSPGMTAGERVFRGYKDTVFMSNGELIAAVDIALKPGDKTAIQEKMEFCERDREGKGQFKYPTCGCVFKNNYDVGVPSGMLLEAAGGKKLKYQGVEINQSHANFVYNVAADARAIMTMTFKMQDLVYAAFGVWMEYEMEVLGRIPADLHQRFMEKKPQRFKEDKLTALRAQFKKPT